MTGDSLTSFLLWLNCIEKEEKKSDGNDDSQVMYVYGMFDVIVKVSQSVTKKLNKPTPSPPNHFLSLVLRHWRSGTVPFHHHNTNLIHTNRGILQSLLSLPIFYLGGKEANCPAEKRISNGMHTHRADLYSGSLTETLETGDDFFEIMFIAWKVDTTTDGRRWNFWQLLQQSL